MVVINWPFNTPICSNIQSIHTLYRLEINDERKNGCGRAVGGDGGGERCAVDDANVMMQLRQSDLIDSEASEFQTCLD